VRWNCKAEAERDTPESDKSEHVFPADTTRAKIGRETRMSVTTWLREERLVSSDVCDLILHHARKGVTASHYDFSTLEGPVRKALQDWADYVGSIAGQADGGNVVQMKRA
jgi:hypothetical protein